MIVTTVQRQKFVYRHYVGLLVACALLLLPVTSLGFFSSTQTAPDQQFAAGVLRLEQLASTTFNVTVSPDEMSAFELPVSMASGSVPAQYDITASLTGPDIAWCNTLTLHATGTDGVLYSLAPVTFTSEPDSPFGMWQFGLVADDTALISPGATCTLMLTISAWQSGLQKGIGFVDEMVVTILVHFDPDTAPPPTNPIDPTKMVVINELLWSGSAADSADEWIELRNLASEPIDISGWQLRNAKAGNSTSTLPANTTLPASGVLLIARYPTNDVKSALSESVVVSVLDTLSLSNNYSTNGAVALYTASGVLVDQTPLPVGAVWPAGINQTGVNARKWSMQRGVIPGDGADSGNWYTCDPAVLATDGTLALMLSYWKADYHSSACGTPGYQNLSSNDPTKVTVVSVGTTRIADSEESDESDQSDLLTSILDESPPDTEPDQTTPASTSEAVSASSSLGSAVSESLSTEDLSVAAPELELIIDEALDIDLLPVAKLPVPESDPVPVTSVEVNIRLPEESVVFEQTNSEQRPPEEAYLEIETPSDQSISSDPPSSESTSNEVLTPAYE